MNFVLRCYIFSAKNILSISAELPNAMVSITCTGAECSSTSRSKSSNPVWMECLELPFLLYIEDNEPVVPPILLHVKDEQLGHTTTVGSAVLRITSIDGRLRSREKALPLSENGELSPIWITLSHSHAGVFNGKSCNEIDTCQSIQGEILVAAELLALVVFCICSCYNLE
ncbi:hypothetical protein IE077_002802 [Cardiosporidium cionae]|uniref:C2 domain-containing protein n=1 Tax=Cardiosporidium cionae TaxID=476202 RepID=A0ABQ7J9X1_9APIC|nr:hypothetical protein IE077_002802 [Cardiosporidium cionae]|eukprot:KAF8820796.1 hypothetical protein IE077_002802 [Cardiosporidium cionae]